MILPALRYAKKSAIISSVKTYHMERMKMKIVLQNLTKKFPGRGRKNPGEVTAVDNLTLEIPDGELVGLLGPSGCGKSTTLNLICGLEKPSGGRIFFGEEDVTDLSPELRGVGMVFQNYALYPHLSVRQNIQFPLENLKGKEKLSKEELKKRVEEAARLVQIEDLMDRRPRELSGGQQQRVAIARALVKYPRVLLLDEPLSNLDARLRLQTREEIRKIQKKTGITTVFVTHDQDEAMSICDRIAVMEKGVLMQQGNPQDVYDDPDSLFTAKFLGTPPINIFQGKVKDQTLFLGDDPVLAAKGVPDQEVWAGIRPEGFLPDPEGLLSCTLERVEVMGRDVSILASHSSCTSQTLRAIVNGRESLKDISGIVKFRLKPGKIFLFRKDTGDRIPVDL